MGLVNSYSRHMLTVLFHTSNTVKSGINTTCTLQMRKLRLEKIPQLAQSNRTGKWLSCDSINTRLVCVNLRSIHLANTIRPLRSPGLTQHHQFSSVQSLSRVQLFATP